MKKKVLSKQQQLIRILIIIAITAAAVPILGQLFFYAHVESEKKSNHEKVIELVENDITYEEGKLDEQLDLIMKWIDKKNLTNADLGRLYERASLIYHQKGEDMTYYRYLGYALYFFEHSDEKDFTVNIYLDLANFHYVNLSPNYTQKMMDKADAVEDFEDIKDGQVKAYAYRMQAILESLNGNYEKAEELLDKSTDVFAADDDRFVAEAYRAINDVWRAYVYLETGKIDECGLILDKYKDSDLLETPIYRNIMIRDFVIPYYQTKCYYCASAENKALTEGNLEEYEKHSKLAREVLSEFMANCEENGYEKHELITLTKLNSEFPSEDYEMKANLYEKLDELYDVIIEKQNEKFAQTIDSQINDSAIYMESVTTDNETHAVRNIIITSVAIAVSLAVAIIVIIIVFGNIDGLTNIYNRKEFDKKLDAIKRKNIQYAILMMDIDNFKKINDTYGHLNGDVVIQRVGEILQRESNENTKAYRYGGEEFVLLITREQCNFAEFTAERIRRSMESQIWEFSKDLVITLSLGLAFGKGDKDVLGKADENLYKSKQTGKNKMTMEW